MSPRPLKSPSTPRLSEVARHLVIPAGIVTTLWPLVEARLTEWGDSFDVWQQGLARVIVGKRADGKWAATVGGIVLSIPRQVAKTFIVGRIIFALCVIFPGLRVLWTAHRTRTATNTFRSLSAFARRKKVAPYIKLNDRGKAAIRTTNGEQEIAFVNGSIIMFGARADGFGRGFDEIDIEVFDEAQILDPKALEDMVAATNQARNPCGGLLFFMGTPPRPSDAGEFFSGKRKTALDLKGGAPDFSEAVAAGDAVFVQCSADDNVGREGGPSLDDEKQIRLANPSYPHRTPLESMQRLRANLPGDDAWRREALGVWDPGAGERATIKMSDWSKLHADPPTAGNLALGVKFSLDGQRVSLSASRRPESGPIYGEVLAERLMSDGLAWLVDIIVKTWRQTCGVVIDGKAGRDLLVGELVKAGVPKRMIITPTADEVIAAHSTLLQAVNDSLLNHGNQPGLNGSVASAAQRKIGNMGGWGWEAIGDGDVLPLESLTLSVWAAKTSKLKATGSVPRRLS